MIYTGIVICSQQATWGAHVYTHVVPVGALFCKLHVYTCSHLVMITFNNKW